MCWSIVRETTIAPSAIAASMSSWREKIRPGALSRQASNRNSVWVNFTGRSPTKARRWAESIRIVPCGFGSGSMIPARPSKEIGPLAMIAECAEKARREETAQIMPDVQQVALRRYAIEESRSAADKDRTRRFRLGAESDEAGSDDGRSAWVRGGGPLLQTIQKSWRMLHEGTRGWENWEEW